MAYRLKRASLARIVVGMAALAFPLLAVGSAQAAIAGGNPLSTLSRPDLVSATAITSTNVDYCFDKVLNNAGLSGANFTLSGYRAARTVAATSALLEQTVDTTGKCVRATFDPAVIGDIGNYTVAGIGPGAVQTPATIINLSPDNTSLTVPASLNPTHNGTTGFTVAPDLVGVLPDPTTNTIIFTFDQDVLAAPAAGNFTFVLPSGAACPGLATVLLSGNQVAVVFGPAAVCPVGNAVRADIESGAVTGTADPGAPSPPEAAIVPNSNGITSAPDLVSATLESNGTAIDFVFDKNVSVTDPTDFNAILSTSAVIASTSATVVAASTTSTTIRAVFNPGISMSQFNEFVVWGSADPGAVTNASAPLLPNAEDAKPAGDNAGAFARGFTTGPDAFAATVSKSSGLVTIALDQRAFVATAADIFAVDDTGFPIAPAPAGSVSFPTQAAGPETVTVQFSPGTITTMTNLVLTGDGTGASALSTILGEGNVNQGMSVTSTASLVRAARSHHGSMSKKQLRKFRAHTRAQEKRLLARTLRHLRHH